MNLPGFDVCGECSDGLDYPTPSFSESHPLPIPCPACNGVGSVPGDAAVEAAAVALLRDEWNHQDGIALANESEESRAYWCRQSRAALVAYARLVKETR